MRKFQPVILLLMFCAVAVLGYWLAGTASPPALVKKPAATKNAEPKRTVVPDDDGPKFKRAARNSYQPDKEAADAGALTGQRGLVFKDRAAFEDFLKRAGDRIRVLGRLDALNAVRVGFLSYDDLASLLNGEEETALIFPVDVPTNGEGKAQAGASELGAGLLDWLGVTGDNSTWGTGVRIAILDTGVLSHSAFKSEIISANLVDPSLNAAYQNGHGTAVASMIIGQSSQTPGIAPGSEILSFRIANDLGQSDSFLLAQGIVAAVNAGAQLINISMGSAGDSLLVRNAIEYARNAGSLIIAAAGNNGSNRVSYPAANSGVIAVGAVDALGDHMDFSNTGSQLALSAPGFGINAAWLADQAASVSGTSFSSPIVTGVIAAVMTQAGAKNLTPAQASKLLFAYLNDAGQEGADVEYGAGMPDIGRILNRNTRGIYDAAIASQRIVAPSPSAPTGQIEVLVQNRGTETLVNTAVDVSTPSGVVTVNITTLPPNSVKSIRVPVTTNGDTSIQYNSTVRLSGGLRDSKPANNRRIDRYVPAGK